MNILIYVHSNGCCARVQILDVVMSFLGVMKVIVRKLRRQPSVALTATCVVGLMLFCIILQSEHSSFINRGQDQLLKNIVTDRNSVTDQTKSLIRFMPLPENKNIDNYTFDNVELYPCSQPNGPGADNIEDLMCIPRPNYLPGFKNPCFRNQDQVLKCLPAYNILGFDKCATTDFSSRLTAHPSILKCNAYMGKEIYFWGWRRLGVFTLGPIKVMSLEDYIFNFRDETGNLTGKENKTNQPIVGDGTPIDAWDFRGWPLDPQNKGLIEPKVLAPQLMRHIFQDPKFIILMREPADRLYSDYFFVQRDVTAETFDRDVPAAIQMMNSCLRVNSTRQCFYSNYLYYKMPMRLHISCYSVFLREWLAVFHRKHFLFLRTEDYERNMKETLQAAFSFLGVETLPDTMMENILNRERKFENSVKKKMRAMSDGTRKLLKDFYEPCNRDLAALLEDKKYLWPDY